MSCKATVPTTSTGGYSEDLSVHRPVMETASDSLLTDVATSETYKPLEGHIKAELDSIVRFSIAENREGKLVDGYVLQIYTGNSRNEANEVWYRMDTNFPELNPKISFRQPNFQVRAGKFTDRLEAHRALRAVQEEFPKALLVPDRFKLEYE